MLEPEKSRHVDAAESPYAQWKSMWLQAMQRCMMTELVRLLRGGIWTSDWSCSCSMSLGSVGGGLGAVPSLMSWESKNIQRHRLNHL